MKSTVVLVAFLASLVVLSACAAMSPIAPAAPESPLTGAENIAPSENSPLAGVTKTPIGAETVLPAGTITVTAPAMGTPTASLPLTVTATITASPTLTATASPIAPTATPVPPGTETPATNTPEPQPTESPTPEPPTSTPTATATEGPSPTPTPLPNAVFVRDHRSITRGSDLQVVGEVANGSASPVYNVTVSAAFFDKDGNLLGASEGQAMLPQTLPTQNNPFKITLSNAPASVSSYELALRWDDLVTQGFDRITLVNSDVSTEPTLSITGEVRNDGSSSMSNVVVSASFYDAAGHIIDAYRGTVMGSPIAPGASAPYSVDTGRTDLEFDHFLVQAQGILGR